ncbi:MAG: type II toxin-antitoxin system RelE/ParE family toxin [Leptolyngbya sp. SIOISBB]|nr:type II toxin-antitoxin system RelE/ParE family toxin [Leptolyngbya sp. SIOISBB]
MQFIETRLFTREVTHLLDDEEYRTLQWSLINSPEQGDIIPGMLGCRKLRWKTAGRGKRGGVRVVYYYKPNADQIWMLTVYGKNRKEDLTPTDKENIRLLVRNIKND